MPSYDQPHRERYSIPDWAFGGGTLSKVLKGPPGKKGFVRDILATVTTAMVGTTTVPEIRVGNAASDSSFARFRLGTAAGTGYGTGDFRARSLCETAQGRTGSKARQLGDFANHIALEGNDGSNSPAVAADANGFLQIPADTDFYITGQIGTGGAPAGTADVYVDVDWY
jgi:hypothetical protein